ncbi:hypothetical protein H6F67_11010 [Microcoleus sp. FACHB-1515]|uniref:hypothetical protein n=1 Tax=Cyanophyceae TaxID=3028117 RepID=UPI0016880FE5|nr:hypothetical protein [Microcoleus sp. FACHB-1515]MBD2090384.1 hypothetical protein [Microcoleus sp. FACHB-1515]
MCFLSPEVLARLRFLPIDCYGMHPSELKRYLLETVQMIDRQEAEKSCGDRGDRSPVLGHNLGTSIESTHEVQTQQAI